MADTSNVRSELDAGKRAIALAALYETECWLEDLQRRAADLAVEDHAIIRGIAVRLGALNNAAYKMTVDDEVDDAWIMDAAKTVYGPRLEALDNDVIRAALDALRKAAKGGNHG